MSLRIVEIHPADGPQLLNTEWFVLENLGDKPFSTRSCVVAVQKGSSRSELGTIDPGFVVGPGERVRVVTGNPGKKAQGAIPASDLKTYSLFLAAPVLRGTGTIVTLALRSRALASAEHDPAAPGGVTPAT